MGGGWHLYTSYPKTSWKLAKFFTVIVFISIFISIMYELIAKPKNKEKQKIAIEGKYSSIQSGFPEEKEQICISLKLAEYPNVVFINKDSPCDYLIKEKFQSEIKAGDIIRVFINKKDLDNDAKKVAFTNLTYNGETYFASNVSDKQSISYTRLALVFVSVFISFMIIYFILDKKGAIDKLRNRYNTEPPRKPLSSIKDYNEFGD